MHSRKAAWVQAAVLLIVCAAIALTTFLRVHRPFDRDTLAIQVSQLQSHAAEAQVLADNVGADNLAPGFVRQHAQQLSDKVDSVDGKLSKPATPEFALAKSRAQQLGGSLQSALETLSRNGQPPQADDLDFEAIAQQLDALHKQLKPGG
jgi:hypothetical protein